MMDLLPNEILEQIAFELDGESLVQWKRTCNRFRAIFGRFEGVVWQRRCRAEIPSDVIADIASPSMSPEVVYATWYMQRRLGNATLTKKVEYSMLNQADESIVTSIKMTGDLLVTGYENGRLSFWTVIDDVCERLFGLVAHKLRIFDMILIDHFNCDLESKKVQPVDHHHVLTVSLDNTIKTVPLYFPPLYYHHVFTFKPNIRVQLKQASVFKNAVAVLRANGTVELLRMKFIDERLVLESLRTIQFQRRDFGSWVGFWNFRVTVVQSNMDFYTVPIDFDDPHMPWSCHHPMVVRNLSDDAGKIVPRCCHLFRGDIVIVRTACRQICVSFDGSRYRVYGTLKDLRGIVTCAAVKGNLIVFGTECGSMYLYHFETDEDLLGLELGKPIWRGDLKGGRAILSLDIKLDHRVPALVATNCETVLVVKWLFTGTRVKPSSKFPI